FSKEEILGGLAHRGWAWLAAGLLVSLLTATYMSRMFTLAFLGSSRSHHHPHESGPLMTLPMGLLAILSAGGWLLVRPGGLMHVALGQEHGAAEAEAGGIPHGVIVAAS